MMTIRRTTARVWGIRCSSVSVDERCLDEMLREEPGLCLVHTDDAAHNQIGGSVITALARHPGYDATFPQDNLVRL